MTAFRHCRYQDPAKQVEAMQDAERRRKESTCLGCVSLTTLWGLDACSKDFGRKTNKCRDYDEGEDDGNT